MRYRSMVKMCGLISSKPHTDVVMVAASSPTGIVHMILWFYILPVSSYLRSIILCNSD